jgi:hypothetical protein
MPPIRFRIRSMMAVIALVAVFMVLFLWARYDRSPFFGRFRVVVILPMATILVVIIIFLVAVIVEMIALEVLSWCDRMRRWRLARKSNGPFRSPGPDQSGESKGV